MRTSINVIVSCIAGLLLCSCNSDQRTNLTGVDCTICERVQSFSSIRDLVSEKYWPEFGDERFTSPLIYYTDSASFLCFSDNSLFPGKARRSIFCEDGQSIYELVRLDEVPFHMENKLSVDDSLFVSYFNPIMHCSSAEKALSLIPDIQSTEEWMQLIMHEYFHSFQFRHRETSNFLVGNSHVLPDSLSKIYLGFDWFSGSLNMENELLLKAIATNSEDSLHQYVNQYVLKRRARIERFKKENDWDISLFENFWEKIEGTARYAEYNTGYVYSTIDEGLVSMKCDTLFLNYKLFKGKGFDQRPWFLEKTKMMPAYYYVTGFNLCRVLDKLKVNYKDKLFSNPDESLLDVLVAALGMH